MSKLDAVVRPAPRFIVWLWRPAARKWMAEGGAETLDEAQQLRKGLVGWTSVLRSIDGAPVAEPPEPITATEFRQWLGPKAHRRRQRR